MMQTSARNQLTGKIVELNNGAIMTEVKVEVGDGVHILATVTNKGSSSLDLKVGDNITALVKASSIVLCKQALKTTARNNIQGVVSEVKQGAVNSEVKIAVGSRVICAVVTNEAVSDLSITSGNTIYAIFKASSVILIAK